MLARALVNEDLGFAATRWSDALSVSAGAARLGRRQVRIPSGGLTGRVGEPRARTRHSGPFRASAATPGGTTANGLWRLRGLLDLAVGGPGMRRGRRDPESVTPGDTLDFWRVEAVEPGRLLRLAAEMRLPGRAWLQFEVTPADGGSLIRQTAIFDPVGLVGAALLVWALGNSSDGVRRHAAQHRSLGDARLRPGVTRTRGRATGPPADRLSLSRSGSRPGRRPAPMPPPGPGHRAGGQAAMTSPISCVCLPGPACHRRLRG